MSGVFRFGDDGRMYVHGEEVVLAAEAEAEVERLRASLLTVVEQVESCCSRAGLCIDADRVRAEALRNG